MPNFADGLVLAQDVTMVACALVNVAYFLLYLGRTGAAARRLGAAVLVLLNLGVMAEGAYLFTLYTAYRIGPGPASLLAPTPWLLARLLLFLGTAATTALVVRQWRHR
ncbi:MAG: hypothetical protein ACE5IZ_06365 [Dehalococcoidia bacterium]